MGRKQAGAEYIVHGLLSKYLREIEERFKVATKGQAGQAIKP